MSKMLREVVWEILDARASSTVNTWTFEIEFLMFSSLFFLFFFFGFL
jgi:hypothetical protein